MTIGDFKGLSNMRKNEIITEYELTSIKYRMDHCFCDYLDNVKQCDNCKEHHHFEADYNPEYEWHFDNDEMICQFCINDGYKIAGE